MLFDLRGTVHITPDSMKTTTIDLTSAAGMGVVGEAGTSLFPEHNPHVVGERFAAELIYTGRAVVHDPAAPLKPEPRPEPDARPDLKPPRRVQHGDPKHVQHGDPK